MIVVGSCYFLLTLLIPYDPNIDFVFPLTTKCILTVTGTQANLSGKQIVAPHSE